MSDTNTQRTIYAPHKTKNGTAWTTGDSITAEDLNHIENEITFLSKEVNNAINNTIYGDTPDPSGNVRGQGDLLSQRINNVNGIIVASKDMPTNVVNNKIWIKTEDDTTQVTIPTMADLNDFESAIVNVVGNIAEIKDNYAHFQPGYINTARTTITYKVVPTDEWQHAIINCKENENYYISGSGGAAARLWRFVDKNDTPINDFEEGSNDSKYNKGENNGFTYYTGQRTVPSGAVKLIINNRTTQESIVYRITGTDNFSNLQNTVNDIQVQNATQINEINAQINEINQQLDKNSKLSFEQWTELSFKLGAYCRYSKNKWITTDDNNFRYIKYNCQPGEKFKITNIQGGTSTYAYTFGNDEGTLTPQSTLAANIVEQIIIAPNNATYLIINDKKSGFTGKVAVYNSSFKTLNNNIINAINENSGVVVEKNLLQGKNWTNEEENYVSLTVPCKQGDKFFINCLLGEVNEGISPVLCYYDTDNDTNICQFYNAAETHWASTHNLKLICSQLITVQGNHTQITFRSLKNINTNSTNVDNTTTIPVPYSVEYIHINADTTQYGQLITEFADGGFYFSNSGIVSENQANYSTGAFYSIIFRLFNTYMTQRQSTDPKMTIQKVAQYKEQYLVYHNNATQLNQEYYHAFIPCNSGEIITLKNVFIANNTGINLGYLVTLSGTDYYQTTSINIRPNITYSCVFLNSNFTPIRNNTYHFQSGQTYNDIPITAPVGTQYVLIQGAKKFKYLRDHVDDNDPRRLNQNYFHIQTEKEKQEALNTVATKDNDQFIQNITGNIYKAWITANTVKVPSEERLIREEILKPEIKIYQFNKTIDNFSQEKFTAYVQSLIDKAKTQNKNHLNVLIFGHSFTGDCWGYTPFILRNYGITVNVYVSYRGNGTIYRLAREWEQTYYAGMDQGGNPHNRFNFHIDTRTMTNWEAFYKPQTFALIDSNDPNSSLVNQTVDVENMGQITIPMILRETERRYSPREILNFANDPTKGIDHWDIITLQTAPLDVFALNKLKYSNITPVKLRFLLDDSAYGTQMKFKGTDNNYYIINFIEDTNLVSRTYEISFVSNEEINIKYNYAPNTEDAELNKIIIDLETQDSTKDSDLVVNWKNLTSDLQKEAALTFFQRGYEPYITTVINLIQRDYKKPYSLGWFCSYSWPLGRNGKAPSPGTNIITNSHDYYMGGVRNKYNEFGWEPQVYSVNTTTGEITTKLRYYLDECVDDRINTLRSQQAVYHYEPFDFILPASTAVFNARTNKDLSDTRISWTGILINADTQHLQQGVPRYVGNLAVAQAILDKFAPGKTVLGDTTWKELIVENVGDYSGEAGMWRLLTASIHGQISPWFIQQDLDIKERYYRLAQKAALMACRHPFDITPVFSPTYDYEPKNGVLLGEGTQIVPGLGQLKTIDINNIVGAMKDTVNSNASTYLNKSQNYDNITVSWNQKQNDDTTIKHGYTYRRYKNAKFINDIGNQQNLYNDDPGTYPSNSSSSPNLNPAYDKLDDLSPNDIENISIEYYPHMADNTLQYYSSSNRYWADALIQKHIDEQVIDLTYNTYIINQQGKPVQYKERKGTINGNEVTKKVQYYLPESEFDDGELDNDGKVIKVECQNDPTTPTNHRRIHFGRQLLAQLRDDYRNYNSPSNNAAEAQFEEG